MTDAITWRRKAQMNLTLELDLKTALTNLAHDHRMDRVAFVRDVLQEQVDILEAGRRNKRIRELMQELRLELAATPVRKAPAPAGAAPTE